MNDTNKTALTCRDTTYLACGARDAPLDAVQLRQLQEHLAVCAYCRTASAQLGELFAQLDELFARPPR